MSNWSFTSKPCNKYKNKQISKQKNSLHLVMELFWIHIYVGCRTTLLKTCIDLHSFPDYVNIHSTFIIHIYCLSLKSLSILPEQTQHIEQFKVIAGYYWTKTTVICCDDSLETKVNANNNACIVSLRCISRNTRGKTPAMKIRTRSQLS